jgi:hypothetical protein
MNPLMKKKAATARRPRCADTRGLEASIQCLGATNAPFLDRCDGKSMLTDTGEMALARKEVQRPAGVSFSFIFGPVWHCVA